MTELEFAAVRHLLNISEESQNLAHAVLVEGKSLRAVANAAGCSFQFVDKNTKVVLTTFKRYQEARRVEESAGTQLPPGWECATLIAPVELIENFRRDIAEYAAASLNKNKST
ncbi:TrfB-related DNA-binding protein (plasmid) [Methylocaldum gracile subsp. desertum]|uniref:TrfB-related DNA-binding protein n=1 Tax=Methylocaldum sp. GT1BW TaxID=3438964 RepID=UPI003DA0ABC6